MASYLPQLLKMKSDLDALIMAIQGGEGAATPVSGGSNSTPDAPKKRGRPSLSKEDKAAAKKAAKKAAKAIAAEGGEAKPKKVLSPEHKAKLLAAAKAGREAAKARKAAEKAAADAAKAAGGSGEDSDSDSDSGAESE